MELGAEVHEDAHNLEYLET